MKNTKRAGSLSRDRRDIMLGCETLGEYRKHPRIPSLGGVRAANADVAWDTNRGWLRLSVDPFTYVPPTPEPAPSDNAANETLLTTLADRNGDFERIDAEMQDIVNVLRARGVSWAAIGQKLAVSRQAAWKRFG